MKRTPEGEEIDPETVCLQVVKARLRVMACLLQNEPASYDIEQG